MAREGGRLGGSKAPGREGDPRDKRIEQQDREISRLRGELARTTRDRDRWKRRSERLKQQLDEARRAGRRQAAPFAKDRPQGRGRRPGRRAGARYGRQGCRPRPKQVDEAFAAPAPTACPDCGGAVEVTRVASQYQEELPEVRPLVRRFDIEVGHCSQCRRRVQGRHALQTSDALGAAGVQLGPGVVGLVVEMHTEMGVPLAKVANLLRNTFNLNVTPGGLARLLHRAARDATPAYQELCEQVRNAPVVTPDETGWRVGGGRHWLWAYATADTTVYAICPGRGFDDAATVLGTDYAGVLVRDGWQVYRCYKDSLHQSCVNHLLRRAKALQEDHPYSPWGAEVKAVLQAGLDVRDRCQNGELTRRGLDVLLPERTTRTSSVSKGWAGSGSRRGFSSAQTSATVRSGCSGWRRWWATSSRQRRNWALRSSRSRKGRAAKKAWRRYWICRSIFPFSFPRPGVQGRGAKW